MRGLIFSGAFIFLIIQISLQTDQEIFDINFLNLIIKNNENLYECEEEFNNEETELIFGNEGEIELMGNGLVIVENPDDCIPVLVENYQEMQTGTGETTSEGGAATIVVLSCQSTRRCTSTFLQRIGFDCMCKEEITCTHLT